MTIRTIRRISRAKFLAISGGTIAAASLAGCSGESGASQPGGGNVPREFEDRLRIVLWSAFADELGDSLQSIVDDFNDSQSEIFVDNQFQGTYEETAQKLSNALAAREVPDIAILSEVTWSRFYFNESLQQLDDYFGNGFSPQDYVEPFIREGTRDGGTFWVPFARSTPLFYYNRDMFERAGLPDRGPKTWSELQEWGRELTRLDGNPGAHVFADAENYAAWTFQGNVWQWNGSYSDEKLNITVDEPEAIEAGDWLYRFVNEEKLGYMTDDTTLEFVNGQAATTLGSTGSVGGILESADFEVGTAFLPEEKSFGCPTGGSGLGIMSSAPDERKEAAFEFIRFASRVKNTSYWAKQTGYMPVTNAALESEEMQSYFRENPEFKVAVDQLPLTEPQDSARSILPNGDQTIGTALERIMSEGTRAETAFTELARQLERDAEEFDGEL